MGELAGEKLNKSADEKQTVPGLEHGLEVAWQQVDAKAEKFILSALVTIRMSKPAQDEQLPHAIEMVCEASGQQFKQIIFKQAIELADYELVMRMRGGKEGKGIQRIGKSRYSFRTVFGSV